MYTAAMTSREAIRASITALQAEIDSYFADAHPSVDQLRVPITNLLEVSRICADSETDLLRLAQISLSGAQEQFAVTRKQLDSYGGPKNSRVYPTSR